ncbi:MAG: type II toxin-antitoxin system VapC family toxin [Planctomycetaceae bacterium]
MYAAGAPHANKNVCEEFLKRVAVGDVDAAIDAEVLQEILHRYRSINRWQQGRTLFDLVRQIVPNVVPITAEVVTEARGLLDLYARLSARDALHAAVCLVEGAEALCSFDGDFDLVAGVVRREPGSVGT